MRLRSSSHRLNCETGRYITEKELIKSNATRLWHKRCEFCVSEETKWLSYLPFCNIIEEDEHHALISCPRFHQLRTKLHEETKSLLLRNEDHHLLYMQPHVTRFGGYVRKVFRQRFPRKEKKTPPANTIIFQKLYCFIFCCVLILSGALNFFFNFLSYDLCVKSMKLLDFDCFF